jgi:hypothetical protein
MNKKKSVEGEVRFIVALPICKALFSFENKVTKKGIDVVLHYF